MTYYSNGIKITVLENPFSDLPEVLTKEEEFDV